MAEIYDIEIKDGLSELINSGRSFAFDCVMKPTDFSQSKSVASYNVDNGIKDLYYFDAILASVGINSNGDVFLPEEIYAARSTPVLKQVNYMHNEKDIIGTIFDSVLLDAEGNVLTNDSEIPKIQDIVTRAVLWSQWTDADLQDRLNKIIAKIEHGELFVSMECLFNEFDYMLSKNGENKLVKRNKETAFLTKYLKWSGGSGKYEDYLVSRVLRKFLFSGKGIVENPANKRSIISDNLISSQAENIMSDKNFEAEVAELKAQLAKATDELSTFKQAAAAQVSQEIESLKAANADFVKQIAELTTLASSAKEEMDKMKDECEAAKKEMEAECSKKVAEAEAQIQNMLAEKAIAERRAKLATAGVEDSKVDTILSTWANVSNEQFEEIAKLYSKSSVTQSTAASFDINTDGVDVNLNNMNSQETDEATRLKALAEKIASKFSFNKKNKKEDGE